MKSNIKWVTMTMLLVTALLLQNCKYYVLKEETQRLPTQRSNHYVIHLTSMGGEMHELTSVIIDQEKKTISCDFACRIWTLLYEEKG